jgi:3-phosphoshikimate 1-carboxyvinyltransferase
VRHVPRASRCDHRRRPRAAGRIQVPGDKSISHRYALLAALADGESAIAGYSPGADCASTLACLRALGVRVRGAGDAAFTIAGAGLRGVARAVDPLDAGNSGTTLRLLAGILAAHPFRSTLTGDASLQRRPMRRVIEPLSRMGARIDSTDGRPPLVVHGGDLNGIDYAPDVPSAQVKSAVLLAGLQAAGRTRVTEPAPTRDHTERALLAFGCGVTREEKRRRDGAAADAARLRCREISRAPPSGPRSPRLPARRSPSSGSDSTLADRTVGSCGAPELMSKRPSTTSAPASRSAAASARTCRSFSITPSEVPGVIDEIRPRRARGVDARATLTARGAELRVKESDRISALATGFRALGARVDEYEDGFTLEAQRLTGGTVDSAGDHRLAMAFAVAAAGAASPTTITGAAAVDVSYPGFFDELERLTRAGDHR